MLLDQWFRKFGGFLKFVVTPATNARLKDAINQSIWKEDALSKFLPLTTSNIFAYFIYCTGTTFFLSSSGTEN